MNKAVVIFTTIVASLCGTLDAQQTAQHNIPIDAHFTTPTPEDMRIWKDIKQRGLLFEKEDRSFTQMMSDLIWQNDPYMSAQRKVNTTLCNEYNAQQRLITTHDNQDIATLIRYAPNAHVTIVYVTGYFAHQTPSKEWSAPFYGIFDDCNIVSYDWRTSGQSKEKSIGTFSHNAIYDVQAMLSLCKSDPILKKTKVVLACFCLGGALGLEALMPLIDTQSPLLPDAFVLSCTPSNIAAIREKKARYWHSS